MEIDEKNLIAFTQRLIRVPSPSGREEGVSSLLAAEMGMAGFERVRIDEVGNVIGRLKGKTSRLRLMLNGHMDHAEPGTMKEAYSGRIILREGRKVIWGRGACDMKAALAAMIYAGKAVRRSGVRLKAGAVVTAVVREEVARGEGILHLLGKGRIKADMAVSGEATDLQIHLGHRGKLEFDLLVKGRTTHSSTPRLGVNAIFQMKKFLDQMERAEALPADPFLGPGTITAIDISASPGRLTPIVPDRCLLVLDRRYLPSESAASVKRQLEEWVRQVRAEDPQFEAEVKLAKDFPPFRCPPEAEVVHLLQEARKKVLGEEGLLRAWRFGVDGTFIHRAGIPCAGFGPGNEDYAHTPEDHVAVEDVVQAARVYARLIVEACG